MSKIYGIDVSHHQGAINWATVAAELRRVNGGTNPASPSCVRVIRPAMARWSVHGRPTAAQYQEL